MMKKALVVFVPVLHEGYLKLFKKHPVSLYILGPDIVAGYTSLTRDLRLMDPQLVKKAIEALGIVPEVEVLTLEGLKGFSADEIVMPDEDVSRDLAVKYFAGKKVRFESVFLRWDKQITTRESIVPPDRVISQDAFDREMLGVAAKMAERSADWWRQIGTVIVQNGKAIISSYNKILPNDLVFATFGDLRSNFDAGEHIDLVATIHGEARAIAHAAREGVSLKGASIYVTTFPCPPCAKLILESGIKKVYYEKGYSLIDAEKLLRDGGVEIILVK